MDDGVGKIHTTAFFILLIPPLPSASSLMNKAPKIPNSAIQRMKRTASHAKMNGTLCVNGTMYTSAVTAAREETTVA